MIGLIVTIILIDRYIDRFIYVAIICTTRDSKRLKNLIACSPKKLIKKVCKLLLNCIMYNKLQKEFIVQTRRDEKKT